MRQIIITLLLAITPIISFAQVKIDKPEIMVKPADNWCISHGYYQEVTKHGITRKIPDLNKAFTEDPDIESAMTTIAQMFIDRGFNVTNIWDEIKDLQQQNDEDEALDNDEDVDASQSSYYDQAIVSVKPDIILEINWQINTQGFEKSLFVNIDGKDAYTNKMIAPMQNQSSYMTSGTGISVLVREAVQGGFEQLTDNLMEYFKTIVEKGREIRINFVVTKNSPINLFSTVNNERLDDLIREWVRANSNNGVGTVAPGSTKNRMSFRGVRIPVQDKSGQKIDAYEWSRSVGLVKYLKSLNVPARVESRGLGAILVRIGAK